MAMLMHSGWAQPEGREPLYDPNANAAGELAVSLAKAASEGKHVLLKVGGNWCKWCYRLHDFLATNAGLDSTLNAHFVLQHVNFSKENKNLYFLASLGYPQRFGFPVLVVLNASGETLHIQSSWYLEDGKEGYDPEKAKDFLTNWAPDALNPANYLEK